MIMSFTDKTPTIKDFLNDLSKNMYGRSTEDSIKTNICVICGTSAQEFKDELSRKEYNISGMCQQCQDEIFGE